MKDKLKDFIQANKASFDEYKPSDNLWKAIEQGIEPKQSGKKAKIVRLNPQKIKWAAAAIIFMVMGAVGYKLISEKAPEAEIISPVTENTDTIRTFPTIEPADSNTGLAMLDTEEPASRLNTPPSHEKTIVKQNKPATEKGNLGSSVKDELYHYTKLIEIKQEQIQSLQTKNPELYGRFSDDLKTLQDSYDHLNKKLADGMNNEKLLQAMIYNLKLQSDLLNKQLEITQQINNSKNEKQYNSL